MNMQHGSQSKVDFGIGVLLTGRSWCADITKAWILSCEFSTLAAHSDHISLHIRSHILWGKKHRSIKAETSRNEFRNHFFCQLSKCFKRQQPQKQQQQHICKLIDQTFGNAFEIETIMTNTCNGFRNRCVCSDAIKVLLIAIEQLSGVDCVSHELDVSQSVVFSLPRWSRFSSSPVSLSAFRWVGSNERVHRSDSITLRRWLSHTGRQMDAPVDHVRLAVPKHAAATNASRNVTAIATIRNASNA